MLRKALLILSGNAAASLLLLGRNLIVARMLPVEDYGIAATFAVAMAVVEMASAFGLQQQIIQSKDGDDPHLQAALQGFQLLRGVASGIILFLLAGPLAQFMGIPEVIWAYQVLAIVPILNALVHFDIHRLNRQMRFGPMILTGIVPAVISLALIWPLTIWFGDWQVMLWSILAHSCLTVTTSHLMAERPWRAVFDRAIIAGSLRFGWPLLVNAFLMFLVFQGDKLIVGRVMGMEALAIFAMGVTLTLTPTLVLAKSVQNLFLPKLSKLARGTTVPPSEFVALSMEMLQIAILNGCLFILVVTIAGSPIVALLLGPKYSELLALVTLFGLLNGLRLFKSGPSVIALAYGYTGNAMVANLPRVLAIPIAYLLLSSGGTLIELIWLGISAECLGFMLALIMITRRPGLTLYRLWPVALATLTFLLSIGLPAILPVQIDPALRVVLPIAFFILILVSMRRLLVKLAAGRRSS